MSPSSWFAHLPAAAPRWDLDLPALQRAKDEADVATARGRTRELRGGGAEQVDAGLDVQSQVAGAEGVLPGVDGAARGGHRGRGKGRARGVVPGPQA